MQDSALISVIIPVYNGERYLAEAIESVLAQNYPNHEIILVDDGSSDGSATVAGRFGQQVQVHFQVHQGTAAARNLGIAHSGGEFLAFLDADDLWVEHKLALQLAAFAQDPGLENVFGQVEQFISPELDEVVRNRVRIPETLLPGYVAGAMLIKRAAFLRVGLYATTWQIGEMVDWYLRMTEQGLQSVILPDVVLRRRIHTTNQGIRERQARLNYVHILKAALDRRRAAVQA